mmetsp:Transcript_47203/g.78323  ORF Transcript_47203/g.78323 Transcript_47203/m.78323 type:complete len:203 (-) Transcript_47203:209-817(-)
MIPPMMPPMNVPIGPSNEPTAAPAIVPVQFPAAIPSEALKPLPKWYLYSWNVSISPFQYLYECSTTSKPAITAAPIPAPIAALGATDLAVASIVFPILTATVLVATSAVTSVTVPITVPVFMFFIAYVVCFIISLTPVPVAAAILFADTTAESNPPKYTFRTAPSCSSSKVASVLFTFSSPCSTLDLTMSIATSLMQSPSNL